MFRWIIGTNLKYRYLVLAAAALMVLLGLDVFRKMPVDVFPEFSPPLVEIQTEGIGMSTAEVEELITIPLEDALRGTPELDVIRSKSVMSLSSIVMIFKRGTDIMHARQLVQERVQLASARLPFGSSPPVMLQPLSSTSRTMKIGLSSKELTQLDLSMTAYWKIRFRLLRVPGVANVAMWGEKLKQLQIQVDPARMLKRGVTLNEVMEASADALDFGLLPMASSAKSQTVGFIDTANQRLYVGADVASSVKLEDVKRIPVESKAGEQLVLADFADVTWGEPLPIGDAVINDGPGMMLIVEKFPWANTLEVTRGVEAAFAEMKDGLKGIDVDLQIFRPATFIELSIHNLTMALLVGSVLVVCVLGAFLFEWRVALISLLAIPLSLVAAGLVLYWLGTTINTMVLAGFVVAVGSVVDDAIIDVENITRRLRENRRSGAGKSVASVILEASLEIRSPIVAATLIIVISVIPVFFMGGLSGTFFVPLATSYSIALLASMAVALTVTPALCLILLQGAPIERVSPLVGWLQRGYAAMLSRIIAAPRAMFGITAFVVVAGLGVWPLLGTSLLPSFKERDFLMHWLTPPGTSHAEMYRMTVAASRELRSIPGVRNFGAHIGRALVADEVVGIDFTENWISVDPKVDYDETLKAVQDTVDGYPGIYRDVQTYLRERVKEVLTGSSESIVVRIFGPDAATLREQAVRVRDALIGIEGLIDLHEEPQKTVPQIQVTVDVAKAASRGLKPGDVRRAAAVIFAGHEVSDVHRIGKVYDVMVWSTPKSRRGLDDVQNVLLDTPDGGQVRLGDVAEVKIAPVASTIKRENASRRHDVRANVRDRDLGSVVHEVEQRLAKVEFPLGYHAQLLGEAAERNAAQNRLVYASVVAAVVIFMLLQASLRSWRLAALVFLSLPAAMVGGVIAAYLGDGIISLGGLVGFLTVLGIAARNGVLLIHHFLHLEREEGEPFGPELVLRGARERLSPILMTTLATGLALVPLVVTGNIPGQEIEHPMAIIILGGLITSTLLNLFVVPAIYLRLGSLQARSPARTTGLGLEPSPL
nr:efflux RND transporter permease subunit [Mesorhizobium sp. WSM4875]